MGKNDSSTQSHLCKNVCCSTAYVKNQEWNVHQECLIINTGMVKCPRNIKQKIQIQNNMLIMIVFWKHPTTYAYICIKKFREDTHQIAQW